MYKLESAAVVEVQMKLRSHWQLLWKVGWQFTCQMVHQGEQYRWMYREREALNRPERAAQVGVQDTKRCSRGQGVLHRWAYRSQSCP